MESYQYGKLMSSNSIKEANKFNKHKTTFVFKKSASTLWKTGL